MRSRWLFAAGLPPLRVLCASVVSLSLLGYGAYRYYLHQTKLQAQQAEYNESEAFLRRLDQPVSLHFEKQVKVSEWLAEWSRQSSIPVEGTNPAEFAKRSDRRTVSLDVPQATAREALQALADLQLLHWNPVDNERIELRFDLSADEEPSGPREVIHHPLPASLARSSPERLSWMITAHNSGFGTFGISRQQILHGPNHLLVVRNQEVQHWVADFLRALELAVERTESLPRVGLDPEDPRLQPLLLSHGPSRLSLLQQFDQPVTIAAKDLPLSQFTQELTRQTGVPFCLNGEGLQSPGRAVDPPITCDLQNAPLRTVLPLAFGRRGYAYRLLEGTGHVLVADQGASNVGQLVCTAAYPVADLLTEGEEAQLAFQLQQLLSRGRDPFSTPAQLQLCQQLLIARLSLDDHWLLRDLLRAVRRVRSGLAGPRLRVGETSEHHGGLHIEVIDLRPCVRFSPHQLTAVANMIDKLADENVFDWHDVGGESALIKDMLVIRNSPAVIDGAENLLEFIKADLQTGRPVWPGRDELQGDVLNQPLLLPNDPTERNDEIWRPAAYYIGDLLAPRGKLSRTELLARCGLVELDPRERTDPFGAELTATVHLNRILSVRLSLAEHAKLQATLRTLRQEARE